MTHFRRRCNWLVAVLSLSAGFSLQAGGCALRERVDAQTITVREIFDDMIRTSLWGPIRSFGGSDE